MTLYWAKLSLFLDLSENGTKQKNSGLLLHIHMSATSCSTLESSQVSTQCAAHTADLHLVYAEC